MEIIDKQCLLSLTYGCTNWSLNAECKRQINVCLNRAIRKVFRYRNYDSVKDILFGFGMLPMYLYIIKTKLCMIGNALTSQRRFVTKCAMWQHDKEYEINLLLQFVLSK